jgi:hypothetical protein
MQARWKMAAPPQRSGSHPPTTLCRLELFQWCGITYGEIIQGASVSEYQSIQVHQEMMNSANNISIAVARADTVMSIPKTYYNLPEEGGFVIDALFSRIFPT